MIHYLVSTRQSWLRHPELACTERESKYRRVPLLRRARPFDSAQGDIAKIQKLIIGLTCITSSLLLSTTTLANTANWKATEGYQVAIDSSGWQFPVSIQFVKEPKNHPNAPLYYVSELRGRIRVVTQNRQVHTYADHIEDLRPREELPHLKGEFGLTGLCLDEQEGHVYVTTVYRKGGLLFNKIIRFKDASGQKQLGLQGVRDIEMIDMFGQERSSISHQIGHCVISSDRKLYVGTGDAHLHYNSQLLDKSTGKLLRFNLDGTAPKDNPFYQEPPTHPATNYIYAYGFRNPFSLAELKGAIYIGESGPSVDRLLRATPGHNYLWDGTDASMMINGLVTWSEPLGPATMALVDEHPLFPQWNQHLLITASVKAYIEAVWVDNELGVRAPPKKILEYTQDQDTEKQYVVPVAVGHDGIYFSGFLPQADGETHIMKIIPQQASETPAAANTPKLSGEGWYAKLECAACHRISGKGGIVGPALDNLVLSLQDRLNSSEYAAQLDRIDQLTMPPFSQYKAARERLRELEGKEKVAFWIEQRLKEPRFDDPDHQMPNFNLNDEQISALTQFLMTLSAEDRYRQKPWLDQLADDIKFFLTTHLQAWLAVMLVIGILLGLGFRGVIKVLKRLLRR